MIDPNPRQTAMRLRLEAMTEDERRQAVMAMSTSQKAVLNWGDSYGPPMVTPAPELQTDFYPAPAAGDDEEYMPGWALAVVALAVLVLVVAAVAGAIMAGFDILARFL